MNDFYVGYVPKAPVSLARYVRKIIVVLGLLSLTGALVLVVAQMPFANSAFEYGKLRKFEGIIETNPYPTLLVARPGEIAQEEKYSWYLLVAPGKHGADDLVADFDGKHVQCRGGSFIGRAGPWWKSCPAPSAPLDSAAAIQATARDLGPVTVSGEIVDSKCYLGVMNPGKGKVHRDCASRCLSGGIPPIFVTSNGEDQFLLVGRDGRAIGRDALREFIAEPITIQGEHLPGRRDSNAADRCTRTASYTKPDRGSAAINRIQGVRKRGNLCKLNRVRWQRSKSFSVPSSRVM